MARSFVSRRGRVCKRDTDLGKTMTREIPIRQALLEAIDEEMARDETVYIIGEEVGDYNGAYKVTKGLLDKYGEKRVVDSPICEESFSGLAIGSAMTGLRPIVEFMSWNFSFMAADQIISNACKIHYMTGGRFSVPIVFRGPNGAAAQVSSQHSHNVEAIYGNLPGLIIVSPSNAYDAKGLLKTAIRSNNPVLFLENELMYGEKAEVPEKEYLIPFSKAKVVKEGSDITVIAYSRMLHFCKKALEEIKGIDVELIDLRTIKPFDVATVCASVKKTNRCLIVEEGHYFAGIASEIGFTIIEKCFDYLDAPLMRLCQKETPMPYSKVLETATTPSKDSIIEAIEKIMK